MDTYSPRTAEAPTPTAQRERIASLDVLRGFAVLGILVMNIQSYSMASAAYMNPHACGNLSGIDYVAWYACHLLADLKFMSIFSMLFGAGIVLVAERREARGMHVAWFHYRRLFWLLVIGWVHAYAIWHGDVLVMYAMTGAVVFWARRLSPITLFAMAGVLLLMGSGLHLLTGLSMPYWGEAELTEFRQDWAPTDEKLAEEVAMYRGGWLDHAPHRAQMALMLQTFVFGFYFIWRVGGLMLLGMALQKLSVLDAIRSRGTYLTMAILGLVVGLPLIVMGVQQNIAQGWDAGYSLFLGSQFNYWGSLFVATAYIGLVMLACQASWLRWLGPVGQMALTNYLAQSVACTLIFYGHGLGQFGRFSRVDQLLLVAVILTAQVAISNRWLRRYRFGPMEWLWRSLTYGERQPMLRVVGTAR